MTFTHKPWCPNEGVLPTATIRDRARQYLCKICWAEEVRDTVTGQPCEWPIWEGTAAYADLQDRGHAGQNLSDYADFIVTDAKRQRLDAPRLTEHERDGWRTFALRAAMNFGHNWRRSLGL